MSLWQQLVLSYESSERMYWIYTLFSVLDHLSAISQLELIRSVICHPVRMLCTGQHTCAVHECLSKHAYNHHKHVRYEFLLNMEWFSFLSWFYAVIFSNMRTHTIFFLSHCLFNWQNYGNKSLKHNKKDHIQLKCLLCLCLTRCVSSFVFLCMYCKYWMWFQYRSSVWLLIS